MITNRDTIDTIGTNKNTIQYILYTGTHESTYFFSLDLIIIIISFAYIAHYAKASIRFTLENKKTGS